MNAQPKFTDCYGKPLARRRKKPHELMGWQKLILGVFIVGVMPLAVMAAVTQINLANQVKGTLGVANGGTGTASTLTGLVRGSASAMTAAELSGDATTSASNVVTVAKVNGTSVTTNSAADQVILTTASATAGWASVTNCANALQYSTSSHTFGCSGALLSGSFADDETPSGTINSSNQTFTLAHTPSPGGSLELYLNGQLLKPGGADYTLTTNSIATTGTPQTGDVLLAWYRY